VGTDLEEGDLGAVDELCINAMNAILDDTALKEKGVDADTFEELYGFTFTYSSSDESIVELKEGGKNIPVTWALRAEYARLVKAFRLHEVSSQVAAIRRGLISIIPARFLALLTWKELELEVCGSPEIDVALLKQNTTYTGCSSTDVHIKYVTLFFSPSLFVPPFFTCCDADSWWWCGVQTLLGGVGEVQSVGARAVLALRVGPLASAAASKVHRKDENRFGQRHCGTPA
jgi:hypothetical protein